MNALQVSDYASAEHGFYEKVMSLLGTDLLMYCVTGSLVRKNIIPGWSDIDVLLVIKRYNPDLMDNIRSALGAQDQRIKIGVTIFSLEEYNDRYFKDSKTYISASLINQGRYSPRVLSPEVVVKEPDADLRHFMNISDFARFSHELKRELLHRRDEYDEKKVYKTLVLLLKIALWERGKTVFGYEDTLQAAQESLGSLWGRFVDPASILAFPEERNVRYDDYVSALEWFRENTHAIFR